MKKTLLLMRVVCAAVAGCRNKSDGPLFQTTDTYGEAFRGHRVPQNVR